MLDLSIDVHGMRSLKDALHKFVKLDVLKGADCYKCEKCKRPVIAEKGFTIHKAPPVLTVHLKRFTPMGRKLTNPVRYDDSLDMQPYMSEGKVLDALRILLIGF
jgi:ubiquitin carboxyl-terminal hydrolase 36/42